MHIGASDWLKDIQSRYGDIISKGRILEIGSLNMNGSTRQYIKGKEHIGIDRIAGACVDVHVDAEDTKFSKEEFDVIISSSMMEHNPRWREGLAHNLQWLRPKGLIILGWGAEGNKPHDPQPFAVVPVGDVVEFAINQSLTVLDACWEKSRYTPDCQGFYDMVLCKCCALDLIR